MDYRACSIPLLFIFSTSLFAGGMADKCIPGSVNVPCANTQWDIGIQALYFHSSFTDNLSYIPPQSDTTASYFPLYNRSDWGFRAEGSYHFGTGADFIVNWSHIKLGKDQATNYTAVTYIGPFFNPDVNFSFNTRNDFDQVNAVIGQHADLGVFKNIRFYGGLQYAKFKVGYQAIANIPVNAVSGIFSNYSINDSTEFNGIGPVIGLDSSYNITQSFSLTANSQVSILYGRSKQSYTALPLQANITPPANLSNHSIVPSLEGKLGVNYAHSVKQGTLNVIAGYQVIHYFNAVHGYIKNLQQGVAGPGGRLGPSNSDYALYGPYFGVNWVGQV